MDQIKEAFQKVKQDVNLLKQEFDFLKKGLIETREKILEMGEIIILIHNQLKQTPVNLKNTSTDIQTDIQTLRQINSTSSTHPSTLRQEIKGLKAQDLDISIGNQGVPTDRQTDIQTDRHIPKSSYNQEDSLVNKIDNPIEDASKILDSLDNIKKEIRLKFKRLTEQEMLVFSTLYQIEEDQGDVNYKILSKKLNLTESSIRDYIGRLIKKGIPLNKTKINNKNIQLSISPNLKKIASLTTILQLRGL